ncbi:hypothetical protein CWB73_09870 [Pseudoalteromonas phenolica]|jgi:hypothetical protein|uniref:Uncharacterized protein n=1 Tax=Pseudoalteromonas phenolica TaxID=161398 RepID=A0A5S3YTF2_9GAMM|nr:hypothetical protein [Pseudoalteromonas phenolica]TMP80719.1 hypothetical protein CWB73_09870 [Pseudoalteromonas phenolica]
MTNISLNSEIGDPSTLDNLKAIQDWQLAWSRLVAYAWENWNAVTSVETDNGVVEKGVVDLILENPHYYLNKFGYSGTFDTTKIVIIREQDGGQKDIPINNWKSEKQKSYQSNTIELPNSSDASVLENGWDEAFKNNQLAGALVVVLPTPPETDQAMALSDYMAISNYQPFTCT